MICAALAGVSVFASAMMFSACTTSHPKVEMKIAFHGETYTLEYKLYRKRAPSTVQHFLELVEHGYYDGLCVHDYNSSSEKLYTGGYTYDANQTADGGLVEKNYFDIVKDWNMTQTVWDINDKDPVYTLYGEFSDNGFSVENGALKQSYGSLTMYYTPKENALRTWTSSVRTARGTTRSCISTTAPLPFSISRSLPRRRAAVRLTAPLPRSKTTAWRSSTI